MGTFGFPGILEATWCRMVPEGIGDIGADPPGLLEHRNRPFDPWNPWRNDIKLKEENQKN